VAEWAGSVAAWAVTVVVALSAQDSVADSTDFGVDSAATIQGTALALASPTGLITAEDGVIPILTTITPTILTRLIRTPMLIRTHPTTTRMHTADTTRPPACKQMEDRFI